MGTMFSLIKVDVSKAIRFIMTGFHMWNPIYTQTYTACPFGLVLTFYSPFWRICLSSERGCPALPEEPWQSASNSALSVSDCESGLRSKHKWLSVFIKLCLCLECSQCLSDGIQLQIPAASTPGHQMRGPKRSPDTPKAARSPTKPPQHFQSSCSPCWAPAALAELLAPPGHGAQCKDMGWFKNWRQDVTAIQSRASKEKTRQNARSVSTGKFMWWWQNCAVVCSTRSTRFCHFALKNKTKGWGTGGHRWVLPEVAPTEKVQLIHSQRSTVHWKSAQSIFPVLDVLYLTA